MRVYAGALLLSLWTLPLAARDDRPAEPVPVALADFAVTGLGEPRYWLGPVYADVLFRRLLPVAGLLLTDPVQARQQPPSIAPQDAPTVQAELLRIATALQTKYAIGGLIEDKGEQLKITPLVVSTERKTAWSLEQQVTMSNLFQPQVDIVAKRFLPNMGVRCSPAELSAVAAYTPDLPLDALETFGEGWRAYQPDNPSRSLETWSRVAALYPESKLLSDVVAAVTYHYQRLLFDRSLAYYERLCTIDEPDNALAWYRLGELYAQRGRWHEAEAAYARAVVLKSTYFDAFIGLGTARLELGLWQQALMAYDNALLVRPNDPKAMLNRGVVLYRRGMIPEAIEQWNRILKIDPQNELARRYLETYGRPGGGTP